MRAGLLTETILLQESVPVKNEFGATSMEWVDYLQTRANIKFNSGNRVNQNNEIFTSYTLTFTIRYYHKVNEQMRIIYHILLRQQDISQKISAKTAFLSSTGQNNPQKS